LSPQSVGKSGHGGADGQSRLSALWLARLDVDLLRYCESIIKIDARISHRALNLRVAKKELNGT
jgi:hypothetical protein